MLADGLRTRSVGQGGHCMEPVVWVGPVEVLGRLEEG